MKRIFPAVAVWFVTSISPATAETELPLDGVYEGGAADIGKIRLIVEGRDAFVRILAKGCIGMVEGHLAKHSSGELFLVASDYQTSKCAIGISPTGKFSMSLRQGPECSYHHGAACSFNGFVERVR